MSEAAPSADAVARRAVRGVGALAVRHVLLIALNVTGGIALARFLAPAEFGLYAAFLTVQLFGWCLLDLGLTASLVRHEQEPDERHFRAALGAQLAVAAVLAAGIWAAAPALARAYALPHEHAKLFRLVGATLLLLPVQTIAVGRLERALAFGRIAAVEVIQAAAFNATAVALAWRGHGAACFAAGMMARVAAGALLASVLSGRVPVPSLAWRTLRAYMPFAAPYQATALLAPISSAVTPVVVVAVLGLPAAGLVAWASGLSYYLNTPLALVGRLLMPTFARLQAHREALVRAVNHAYAATALIYGGGAALLAGLAPTITEVVYTAKWSGGVPLLMTLVVAGALLPMGHVNGMFAYAMGWSKSVFLLNASRVVCLWGVTLACALAFRTPLAFAMGTAAGEILGLGLHVMVTRHISGTALLRSQLPSVVASAAIGAALWYAQAHLLRSTVTHLVGALLAGGLLYVGLAWCLSLVAGRPIQTLLDDVRRKAFATENA